MMSISRSITIVVPTYESEVLPNVIDSLIHQDASDDTTDILIVGRQVNAGGFTNGEVSKFIEVEERPSAAHNRNVGAAQANGDWLCFVDSDSVPHPEWLEQMQSIMDEETIIAGAVTVPPNEPYWSICDHLFCFLSQTELNSGQRYLESAATINLCIKRDVFMAIGGFDEDFEEPAGEDRDFCYRIRKMGYKIAFIPSAIVSHHHGREDLQSTLRHVHRYGLATSYFRHKRDGSLIWRLAVPLTRIPILVEFLGLGRVLLRSGLRLIRYPVLFKYARYLPGLALLDYAHTLGILNGIRIYEA